MNHRPITEDDLHAYVDHALEPERRAEVATYLEDHPDVAKRISVFSDQRELLRTALAPIADEPLAPELNLSRIIEQRTRRPSLVWWAMAAMLLLSIRRPRRLGRARGAAGVAGRIGCARSGGHRLV